MELVVFQLLTLPILLIHCDGPTTPSNQGINIEIIGPSTKPLKYKIKQLQSWNMNCKPNKKGQGTQYICNSYEDCGFSHRLESTLTECTITKKSEKFVISCSLEPHECRDKECGWTCPEKLKNMNKIYCEAGYQNLSDLTNEYSWMRADEAILNVKDSTHLVQLHLTLDNTNETENPVKIDDTRGNDNTACPGSHNIGWIIFIAGFGGFLLGCLFVGIAVFFRKKQCGCKRDESGSPRESYQMTPSNEH